MVEQALPDDFEADDVGALLKDACRCRGHGSGQNAADVGVVSTGSSEEDDLLLIVIEYGADDGDIWEVAIDCVRDGAAEQWIYIRTIRLRAASCT